MGGVVERETERWDRFVGGVIEVVLEVAGISERIRAIIPGAERARVDDKTAYIGTENHSGASKYRASIGLGVDTGGEPRGESIPCEAGSQKLIEFELPNPERETVLELISDEETCFQGYIPGDWFIYDGSISPFALLYFEDEIVESISERKIINPIVTLLQSFGVNDIAIYYDTNR